MRVNFRLPWLKALVALGACLLANSAAAIEEKIEPSAPPAPAPAATEIPFDINFGTAITSDYVSRGITNSNSDPAIQGYIEPTLGPAYVNIWSSNVD